MLVIKPTRNPALDDGVWTVFRGSELKIAHTTSAKFQSEMSRLQAPHRKAIERGTVDPNEMKEIAIKALAATILNDWDHVVDTAGAKVPFTREMALLALRTDDELREFVQEFSTDLANYREQDIKEKGNG